MRRGFQGCARERRGCLYGEKWNALSRIMDVMNGAPPDRYGLVDEPIPIDPSFPIFVFSFALSDEPIRSLHAHDTYEFGVCRKGSGIFVIGAKIYPYESGDVFIIPPGQYHRAKKGVRGEDLWHFLYMRPADWLEEGRFRGLNGLIHATEAGGVRQLLNEIVREMDECNDRYQQVVRSLLTACMIRIERVRDEPRSSLARSSEPTAMIDERLSRSIDIMMNSSQRKIQIGELARHVGLSEPHFRHLFKEQTGVTPKHFQLQLKVHAAMNLLKESSLRVVEISERCGFESLSSFNRQFKRFTGYSPRHWRANAPQR